MPDVREAMNAQIRALTKGDATKGERSPCHGHMSGTHRVKTLSLAMRRAVDNMEARQECIDTMRELFRQFMSVLIQNRTKLEQHCI